MLQAKYQDHNKTTDRAKIYNCLQKSLTELNIYYTLLSFVDVIFKRENGTTFQNQRLFHSGVFWAYVGIGNLQEHRG